MRSEIRDRGICQDAPQGRIRRELGEVVAEGESRRAGAIVTPCLREDIADMDVYGALAEGEHRGDLAVGMPSRDEAENLDLTLREADRIARCGGGNDLRHERVGASEGGHRAERLEDRAGFV